jgi:hypothetical protein
MQKKLQDVRRIEQGRHRELRKSRWKIKVETKWPFQDLGAGVLSSVYLSRAMAEARQTEGRTWE